MSTGIKNLVRTLDSVDFLKMDRRTFMKALGAMGAAAFLNTYQADMVKALEEFPETKLLWIHGSECTGCSESVLNAGNPDLVQALQKLNVNLAFHETLCAQQGIWNDGELVNTSELNSEILQEEIYKEGNYILVVEGSIPNGPDGSGRYLVIGNKPFKQTLGEAAKNAVAIVAVGACAAYGGITSADSDIAKDTDYKGVAYSKEIKGGMLKELGIDKPVINIPGCPAHPDWVLLTLGAVILGKIKIPDDLDTLLDEYGRPKVFFPPDHVVHDNCPRRGYYDRGELDEEIGGPGCLWKLGCKAPYAHADCGIRRWNGSVSMCTQAGGPCIACVEPGFPDSSRPLFVEREDVGVAGTNIDTIAKVAVGAAAVAAGVHAVRRMGKGE